MEVSRKHMASTTALLNGFKLLWTADVGSGPRMGMAAKSHQNQGGDAVHGTPRGLGDGGFVQFRGTRGQQHPGQYGAGGDTGAAGGQRPGTDTGFTIIPGDSAPLRASPKAAAPSQRCTDVR